MKHISQRFHQYLLDTHVPFMKKSLIEHHYSTFKTLWAEEHITSSFQSIFETLRKQSKLSFLFDNSWAILTIEEAFAHKHLKLQKIDIIIKFLEYNEIPWYFGLSSAKYFLNIQWQHLTHHSILNTTYTKTIKLEQTTLNLIKIPTPLIINNALITSQTYKYSNLEKTTLDEIYLHLTKHYPRPSPNYAQIDFSILQLYLNAYPKSVQTYIEKTIPKKYTQSLHT